MVKNPPTLLVGPVSIFSTKAIIAVREKGIECNIQEVPFSIAKRYDPIDPLVAKHNPKRQVPVLIDGDLAIYDSTLIFEYLEDAYPSPPLWPSDTQTKARARQLELEADEVLFPPIMAIINSRYGLEIDLEEQNALIQAALQRFITPLSEQAFLVGEFSYADIALISELYFAELLGVTNLFDDPSLAAWLQRMLNRGSVAETLGKTSQYVQDNGLVAPPSFQFG